MLHPNRAAGERSELLICAEKKIRGKERISIKIACDDKEEDLPLEVKIE